MKSKDELDEILDRALSSYVEAEPLTGLEHRILKRAQVSRSSRPLALRLIFALGTLALCGILLWNLRNQSTIHHKETKHAWPSPPVLEAAKQQQAKPHRQKFSVKTVAITKRRPAVKQLPKLPVFPTPSPLTREERVLVAFVRNHPNDAIKAFSDLQKQMNEPIQIQPIEIRPLDSGEAQ